MPSRRCTRTWLLDTVLVSGRFTYVFYFIGHRRTRNPWADVGDEQILRVVELQKADDVRRPYIKQLLVPGLKFPLPHRVGKTKSTFVARRPSTF